MSILWNSDYATGHLLIDAQHQELFNWFNVLLDACKKQQGRQEIINLFNFLDQYVVEHFTLEEGLMLAHNSPESDSYNFV